jgi:Flp pilus assembly protein TadG
VKPIQKRMRRNTRREKGQAVVELALVLPIVLMLLLGIVQFGMLFKDYIALTDATRAAARQGSVARSLQPPSSREPSVVSRAQKAGVNLDPAKMTITVELRDTNGTLMTPNDADSSWVKSGDVTVRTSYPFKVKLLGLVLFTGALQSRTTERIE